MLRFAFKLSNYSTIPHNFKTQGKFEYDHFNSLENYTSIIHSSSECVIVSADSQKALGGQSLPLGSCFTGLLLSNWTLHQHFSHFTPITSDHFLLLILVYISEITQCWFGWMQLQAKCRLCQINASFQNDPEHFVLVYAGSKPTFIWNSAAILLTFNISKR